MKKLELAGFIQDRVSAIQEVHRFDPGNGYAQLYYDRKDTSAVNENRVRSYGEFAAFQDIVERFELPVDLDPPRLPEPKRESLPPAQKANEAFKESVRLLEVLS